MNTRAIKTILQIAPITAGILIVIEITLTSLLVGSGHTIRTIDIAVDALRQENALLIQQVASASSLLTIDAKAREMGFVTPDKSQFLTLGSGDMPVALGGVR